EHPARADLREEPAFRRLRIDVVEMREVRRIFQVTERRDAVALGLFGGLRRAGKSRGACKRAGGGEQRIPARDAHWRAPLFAAFAGSCHQTNGKADAKYCGSFSGWLKR